MGAKVFLENWSEVCVCVCVCSDLSWLYSEAVDAAVEQSDGQQAGEEQTATEVHLQQQQQHVQRHIKTLLIHKTRLPVWRSAAAPLFWS